MSSYITYSLRIHLSSYQLFDWIGINLSCGLTLSLTKQFDQLKVLFWSMAFSIVLHIVNVVVLFNNFCKEEFNFEKLSNNKKNWSRIHRIFCHNERSSLPKFCDSTTYKSSTGRHCCNQKIDQNYQSKY